MSSNEQQSNPNPATDSVWDSLTVMFQNMSAYTLAPATVLPFIRNNELIERVADKAALLRLAEMLNRDVKEYSEKLAQIHAQHADRTGPSVDPSDNMRAIQIGEQYMAWASSYEAVVIPNVESILDMFASIGADVSAARPQQIAMLPAPDTVEE